MNTRLSPHLKSILPLLLLTVLYACSSSQPRPDISDNKVQKKATAVVAEKKPVAHKKIQLKTNYPRQYTVKKGDTLWGIASLYLRDPWYWPQIWQLNPQVKNPHRIYPGDVLTLTYVNGRPLMLLNGSVAGRKETAEGALPIRKLSPGIHRSVLNASIPSIPSDAISQFLTKPRVVTKEQLENAPIIIGSAGDHLILSTGSQIYIRGELDKERARYSVFQPGKALIDPQTGKTLGYETKYAGDVHITDYGDPATGKLIFTRREVLIGDRLLPEDKSKMENKFFPKIPNANIKGQIISLYDALFGVASYQIVIINRGERDGVEVGDLLATFTKGETIRDNYSKEGGKVKLPNERSGLIMIFKTFDRVSYALVMQSHRVIHRNDVVRTPKQ